MKKLLLSLSLLVGALTTNAQSLNFDGIDDYVQTDNAITISNPSTIEAWVKINTPRDWDGIVTSSTVETDNSAPFIQLTMNPEGMLRYEIHAIPISEGLPVTKSYLGTTELAGAWHHVAVSLDGANIKVYIDGIIEGEYTDEDLLLLSENPVVSPLLMGAERNLNNFLDGTMDEVKIWNASRTEAQIQEDMNYKPAIPQEDLIAYYDFNDGNPNESNTENTTLTDLSGNENNGTLNYFALSGSSSNWTDDSGKGTLITGNTSSMGNQAISIHPNPATDVIYLQKDIALENATIEIYDMTGQKVLSKNIQDNLSNINLSNLHNSVYQIRVLNNGNVIYQNKVVKQ
ncbi:MAG: T9SS type A sorting domain-containing protein [Sporocytophaga sp.]|uniref:LamG-like jellyroll fold domain-containing protein n=1 Tax=Sporocytophaga sp. TaxID=2231183 RepID=UPI001B28A684|nr:LamG-like jellyroll fold domain-containing protein [Sporocytophaga sp.]MBO9700117.1 T9SS type A sorting domain-containing protein [Sporocytophaga sp.]